MKKLVFILIVVASLIGYYVYATTQGANSPGTMADDATVGTVAWTNQTNAGASDDSRATTVVDATEVTHYLKATNFGFTIPVGATINGVVVEIERSCAGSALRAKDSGVYLVKGGTVSGNNKADTSITWPTTDTYKTYGDSSDLWGLTLNQSDVNASTFGVVISATNVGASLDIFRIDHIRITVYFSTPSGSPQIQVRSGVLNIKSGTIIVK